MKKLLSLLILIAVSYSCHTAKEVISTEESTRYTEMDLGLATYVFKQSSQKEDCDYHTKEDGELVRFIEMDYSGDRDDKLPRRVADFPVSLSKNKSTSHPNHLRLKICYSTEGEVVAFRYEVVSNLKTLHEKLFDIRYEKNIEDACVVCKTENFYFRD